MSQSFEIGQFKYTQTGRSVIYIFVKNMVTDYIQVWLVFADIQAIKGKNFNDLIDLGDDTTGQVYSGAWANILIKCAKINDVVLLVERGLKEIGMQIKFIDKIENFSSLVEYDKVEEKVIEEVDWLLTTDYQFMISDKIFPYEDV